MIVIACNTATAVVWEEIKAQLDIPVLGVILPGARQPSSPVKVGKSEDWNAHDGTIRHIP